MSVFDHFFNFWKVEKPVSSHLVSRSVTIDELSSVLSDRFSAEEKMIYDPLIKKFSQIKFVLKSIQLQLKTLNDSTVLSDEGNQRLRKVVETTKFTFLRQMDHLVERLSPPTSQVDFQSYALNAHSQLQKEIQFSGKNIVYTGVILKEEMKELGELLQELEGHLLDIQKLYLMKPLVIEYPNLTSHISSIQKLIQEKKSAKEELKLLQAKELELTQSISSLYTEQTALHSSPEFEHNRTLQVELEKTVQQKRDLEQLCLNLFSPVDKAINKLQSLVEGKQFFLQDQEEAQVLALLNTNPFLALKRDISGKKIKGILEDCLQLVHEGKLSFKEKELDKKIESLQFLIGYDFYGQFFWKLNDIEKKEQEIKSQLTASPIAAKDSDLKNRLMDFQNQLASVQNQMKQFETTISSISSKISIESSEFQNKLTKSFSEPIVITFE